MFYSICILAVLPTFLSFRFTPSTRIYRGGVSSLKAGIDVSGLTFIPTPADFNLDTIAASTSSGGLSLSDLSNALIVAGGVAYFAYEKRPRGSARNDLIEIRKSTVSGGSLGVFAKKYIAEGTELGCFPGFLVASEEALAAKTDDKARASAKKYFFILGEEEGEVIDPTNKSGLLELEITFLGGIIKVDTMLARVNEPPKGKAVNVFTRINGPEAVVVADRDIFADEEIFMDCGRYDFANYEKEQLEVDAKRLSKIRLEEEEMMTLRPITTDKTGGKIVYEQDTSLPDGFLRKLAKQDEKKFKKVGILSPEEGAGMFADLGNNMFGNKEDRDLIEGMQGKESENKNGNKSRGKGGNMVDSFSREGDDEDLLESLKSQLGAKNLADLKNIPDITNPTGENSVKTPSTPTSNPTSGPGKKGTGAPVPGPSIFDSRVEKKREVSSPVKAAGSSNSDMFSTSPVPTSSSTSSPSVTPVTPVSPIVTAVPVVSKAVGDSFETPSTPTTPTYGPALTATEAEKLQDSLDDMTDEEVAGILSKLRAAVSDRIKEEVTDAMVASGISRKNASPDGNNDGENGERKMPRAPTQNPEIREKYEKEFNNIENELEKIYSDPLGTWQEMMANPEKFLEENEIGELSGDDK